MKPSRGPRGPFKWPWEEHKEGPRRHHEGPNIGPSRFQRSSRQAIIAHVVRMSWPWGPEGRRHAHDMRSAVLLGAFLGLLGALWRPSGPLPMTARNVPEGPKRPPRAVTRSISRVTVFGAFKWPWEAHKQGPRRLHDGAHDRPPQIPKELLASSYRACRVHVVAMGPRRTTTCTRHPLFTPPGGPLGASRGALAPLQATLQGHEKRPRGPKERPQERDRFRGPLRTFFRALSTFFEPARALERASQGRPGAYESPPAVGLGPLHGLRKSTRKPQDVSNENLARATHALRYSTSSTT